MAERGGFEPPVGFDPYDGLANRSFRPLRHLSGTVCQTIFLLMYPDFRKMQAGFRKLTQFFLYFTDEVCNLAEVIPG